MNGLEQKLVAYHPSIQTVELIRRTAIVLLVGISGAGKDTIKQRLLATGEYHHIVSHTTRPPRENGGLLEKDGVDYHFITRAQAMNMLDAGDYVEAKIYGANIYGTSVSELQRAHDEHKIALTDIEVQGVAEYKAMSEKVTALFILPPDFTEWQRRLHARYGVRGVDPEDLHKRMRTAVQELEEALTQPYYHFIINRGIDHTVAVADKIAHGHNVFNDVDLSVRQEAETLLASLKSQVN